MSLHYEPSKWLLVAAFGGRVTVGRQTIEYRGYGLQDGRINVGTYYPIP